MNRKMIAKEIVKIAKMLIGYDWGWKLIGKDFRLQHDIHNNIRMEELHAKGKRFLRVWTANIWTGGHFRIINPQNITQGQVTASMNYDQAKAEMEQAIEHLKQEEVAKHGADPKHMEYAVRVDELTVNAMKIQPEGMEKMLVEGNGFKVESSWTKFSSYSPGSDFQSMDPSYTVVESSSPTSARKLYRILKTNPDMLKSMTWDGFVDWIKHNGIQYKMNFSQWR